MSFQNQDQSPKRVCLGKIVAAHGVKGLVKILPFGEDASLLQGALYTNESGPDSLSVTLKNPLGKYILAAIDGCVDRNRAEELRGTKLFIGRDALPVLDDGDGFYYEDLIGLKALSKDGEHIGKVIAVDDFGAGDLLEIQPVGGGQSYYVPFNEQYVPNTDLEAGTVTIIPLEMG